MTPILFAETARDAWAGPRNAPSAVRELARSAILSAVAPIMRPSEDFVRCLYAHAVFPEHRERFRTFLRSVKNMGDFIDTPTLISLIRANAHIKGRYFHLSFDDGFANVVEVGGPILASERVPATLFLATDLVEAADIDLARYFERLSAYSRPVRIMTWAQVGAAAGLGLEIGSHTRSHARLSEISGDLRRLGDELLTSKQLLERTTGRPCIAFAWPYGTARDIDAAALASITDAGYEISFSAVRGRVRPTQTDILQVPRHQVEFHWPLRHSLLWARGFREAS